MYIDSYTVHRHVNALRRKIARRLREMSDDIAALHAGTLDERMVLARLQKVTEELRSKVIELRRILFE